MPCPRVCLHSCLRLDLTLLTISRCRYDPPTKSTERWNEVGVGSERLAWQPVANGSCTSLAARLAVLCSPAIPTFHQPHQLQVLIPAEHWHSLLLNGEELYSDGEEGTPMMFQ